MTQDPAFAKHRHDLYEIIFEADTPGGKWFDLVLIVLIVLSVVAVMLESIAHIRATYGTVLRYAEWGFTIVFTVEYVLRLYCVRRPLGYALSFFGVVDLLAILPTYLSLLVPGGQALAAVRALRLLRVFRVLKLGHHLSAAGTLMRALRASRPKIVVFVSAVLTLMLILGTTMYLVEGPPNGFTSIPRSVYWAIVTMTTVGYGDITPRTNLGQVIASIVMITGYAIIAIPTGIVTTELGRAERQVSTQVCPHCRREGHELDASHCKYCGAVLNAA